VKALEGFGEVAQSWMGHHYGQLIGSWGPPQQVYEDGQGGRILIWTQARFVDHTRYEHTQTYGQATVYDDYIWGSATSRTTYTPPQTYGYTAHRTFYVNNSGCVYHWAWRGL
jgi:hypothetical protein